MLHDITDENIGIVPSFRGHTTPCTHELSQVKGGEMKWKRDKTVFNGSSQPSFAIDQSSSTFIRLLPLEIIVEIFKHCIFPIAIKDKKTASTITPLFIGSICSSWRRIAWSTPSLWSTFSLGFRSDDSLSNTKIELLEQWLSRTRNLPLSITLFLLRDADEDPDDNMEVTEDGTTDNQTNGDDIQMDDMDQEEEGIEDDAYIDSDGNSSVPDSYVGGSMSHNADDDGGNVNSEYVVHEDDDDNDSDWITCASDEDDDEKDIQWLINSRIIFLRLMGRYTSRWHNIDFRLSADWLKYFSSSPLSFPNLKTLCLQPSPSAQPSIVEDEIVLDLKKSRLLRNINLTNIFPNSIRLEVRWDRILRLELTICSIEECLEILSLAPQMVSFSLVCPLQCRKEYWRFRKQILLPSLKELALANELNIDLTHLFNTISTPNLTEFCYDGGELTNCTLICQFISSSPLLRMFSLRKTSIPSHDVFIQLLRGLRKVVRLTFVAPLSTPYIAFNDYILGLCTPSGVNDTQCLLPALETLIYTGPQTFTWPAMGQFLEGRKPEILGAKPGYIAVLQSATIITNQSNSAKVPWICHCKDCRPPF